MTQELKALQSQYLEGVETMNEADAQRYLTLLEADYGAEFREVRISALSRRIQTNERIARAEQRTKDEYARLAEYSRQLKAITDGWEAQGAVKRVTEYADMWSYEGREIFRMYGALSGLGKRIDEYLADAQRIDEEVFGKGAIE